MHESGTDAKRWSADEMHLPREGALRFAYAPYGVTNGRNFSAIIGGIGIDSGGDPSRMRQHTAVTSPLASDWPSRKNRWEYVTLRSPSREIRTSISSTSSNRAAAWKSHLAATRGQLILPLASCIMTDSPTPLSRSCSACSI